MSHTQREDACSAGPVPSALREELDGYQWARNNAGMSGAEIYRLYGKANAPELYLKYGKHAFAGDITAEMVRHRWLASHLPLPAIVHFSQTSDEAWLLTTAVPGKTACQMLETHPEASADVVDALAVFMRRLHAIPVSGCPFNSGHMHRLSLAHERIGAGLVDIDDFDDERRGWTAEQVWKNMHTLLPFTPDPVVAHGDFSLDNLFIHEGQVTGMIDVGRAGVADRYQDLAILWNCLGEFDPALQERLFRQYGIISPDSRKLQFHRMLDEFF